MFETVIATIRSYNRIIIHRHKNPDGDALGSQLGLAGILKEAFPEKENFKVHVCTKGVFYPSDQAHFPYGVGVAALNRSRRGILYMDKIHTPRDTVFCEENIEFLTDGALRLTQII